MSADFIVIGAGMAGASAAAELADGAKVIVLEMEAQPGYHSTGRSAAVYVANYGNETICKLNRASWQRLSAPPATFAGGSFLSPRGALYLASPNPASTSALRTVLADAHANDIKPLSLARAFNKVPALRPPALAAAAFEANVMDIDVHTLHQSYLRQLRQRGGELYCDARVQGQGLRRRHGLWQLQTARGEFSAPVIVNAAGAWADGLAEIAGIKPLGLKPCRRSAALINPPAELNTDGWPLVIDAEERFYCKPDAGRLMISPADETPVEAHDASADELALAEGINRFEQVFDIDVRRVEHRWAGLRTFAPDRTPVVGYEPASCAERQNAFFWLAGQGGYGIQTAPAMALLASSLARHEPLPDALLKQGVAREALDPARLR